MLTRSVLAVMLVASAGCFAFAESTAAPPGQVARVTLGVTRAMGDGSRQPIRVEGLVVSSTVGPGSDATGAISLEQVSKQPVGDFREVVTFDTVSILQYDIRRLEIRRFSWIRSGIGVAVLGTFVRAAYVRFKPSTEVR
jgi:hypothetical protein